MGTPTELPMAVADCGLSAGAFREQMARYHALGAGATVRRASALELAVQFAAAPDPELLRTTIETERQCCAFFALDYAADARRLTIAVADPARAEALDQIQAALTASVDP